MKRFNGMPILFIVVAAAAVVGGWLWWSSAPKIALAPVGGAVSGARGISVSFLGRGVKRLTVSAVQEGKSHPLLSKALPGVSKGEESFTLSAAALKEGPFTLQVAATGSILFGITGRSAVSTHPFTYDNTPPAISPLAAAHNIIRGGAGLAVFTVSEEVEKAGVLYGGRFAPAYRQQGGAWACLFPFPYNMEQAAYVLKIVAVDKAGNERVTGINFHLIIKPFSTDRIELNEALLSKISDEFRTRYPQAKSPLELFLKVNGELREQNRNTLQELSRKTSPTPLWQGESFLRMPNTAPLGGFAQTRTYLHQGQKVDEQTHLGFDLASVMQAQVPAANRGKVVLAGDLGIYGQCVVIDHGLGMQTVYSHLSRISVKEGDTVDKGQIIGATGATGMALGDHLHFGVTVAGEEVNPVEWWDSHWIRDNILGKLAAAGVVIPK